MHTMIIGVTTSGKSTFAKHVAHAYQKKGVGVIVFDPLGYDDWPADLVVQDRYEFLRAAKSSKSCALFVDESAETIGRFGKEMVWTATQSRHWGHKSYFISQRAMSVDKTVRDQCENLVSFRVSHNDGKLLAEEFAQPSLTVVSELDKYEYIACGRFVKPTRGKVKPYNPK